MIADPFAVIDVAQPPAATSPARKPSSVRWRCGWCLWETDKLREGGLPPHQEKRVRLGDDGQPEEYDAGWCAGGGHEPEAVAR